MGSRCLGLGCKYLFIQKVQKNMLTLSKEQEKKLLKELQVHLPYAYKLIAFQYDSSQDTYASIFGHIPKLKTSSHLHSTQIG